MDVRRIASSIVHGKYDKTVHWVLSFLLSFLGFFFLPVSIVVVGVAALGLLKELYDATKETDHFDFFDIAANLGGIAAAYIVWRIF